MQIIREKSYTESYVAFIDLLGFKSILKHYDCESVAKLFDIVEEEFEVTYDRTRELFSDFQIVHRKVMSDSICLYIDASIEDALIKLIAICNYFQVDLLRNREPILSRGAIVKGGLFHQNDIMFGNGFVNAYLLEENVAKNPRIIMTREVLDSVNRDSKHMDYINQFVVEEADKFFSIDYLYLFYGLNHEKKTWKNFATHVKYVLDTETDLSIREKYLYLDKQIARVRNKYVERFGEQYE